MGAERNREILDAAADLFFARGYHRVGMGDIGARVGMSGPALYRHFASKEEILATLLEEVLDALDFAVERLDDPFEELEALVRGHADLALAERELISVYTHEERALTDDTRRRFANRVRGYVAMFADIVGRCYPEADAESLAAAVSAAIGTLNSVPYWSREGLAAPDACELLTRTVMAGLSCLATVPE